MKQYMLSFYWACTSLTTNVRLSDCYAVSMSSKGTHGAV